MTKPYIDTYENKAGEIVIVYVAEIRLNELVEPEYIVINSDHIDELISELKELIGS